MTALTHKENDLHNRLIVAEFNLGQVEEELRRLREENKALRARLAQPEPEPVAWIKKDRSSIEVSIMSAEYMMEKGFDPLYTAPPQREWQGLTDEERTFIAWESNNGPECVAMTEAKLKEKNT